MDLTRWSPHDYYCSALTKLLLMLGASPYRCEYCRVNFVTFRRRRERFRRMRGMAMRAAGDPAPATAAPQPDNGGECLSAEAESARTETTSED